MVRRLLTSTLSVIALAFSMNAVAANSGVTYQGRILKPDGTPLSGSNVQFRLQIKSPDANSCLMYEELQTQDMSTSHGNFSLTINDGSGVRNDTSGYGLDRIFANRGVFTFVPTECVSGSDYTPGSGDGRTLQVYFKDETMSAWEPMPPQKINFVPFAFESKQVAGFGAANLLRFAESDGTLVNTSPLNNTQYTELVALVNGSSTVYEKAGKLAGGALPTLAAGQVLGWNGTAWTAVDPSSASASVLKDPDGGPNKITFQADPALASDYTITWPLNTGVANQVLTTDGTGKLTWAAPTVSTQWTTSGSNIYYNTGNVGVGTTAPMAAVHTVSNVTGSVPSVVFDGYTASGNLGSSVILRSARGTAAAPAAVQNGDRTAFFGVRNHNGSAFPTSSSAFVDALATETQSTTGAGTALAFGTTLNGSTGNVERVRIDHNGNVGIGTSSPTDKLSVNGLLSGGSYSSIHRNTLDLSSDNGSFSAITYNLDVGASPVSFLTVKANVIGTGDVFFQGKPLTNGYTVLESFGGKGTAVGTGGTTPVVFTPNRTERMRIDSAGNVGIGTTAPTDQLHIASAASPTAFIQTTTATSSANVRLTSGATTGVVRTFGETHATKPSLMEIGPIGGTAALAFLSASGAERMRIDAAGNVGIGTNAPSMNLDVVGQGRFSGSSGGLTTPLTLLNTSGSTAGAGSTISFDTGTGGIQRANIAGFAEGTNLGAISFSTRGTNPGIAVYERMRIDSAGTVGINTTTPNAAYKLDVNGAVNATSMKINGVDVAAATNYWTKAITDISYTSGNVGVGTATPAYPLDVTGAIRSTSSVYAYNFTSFSSTPFSPLVSHYSAGATNEKYWDFFQQGNSFALRAVNDAFSASNDALSFQRSGNTITTTSIPSGNVGIGTTTPTSKLHVVGGIRATANSQFDGDLYVGNNLYGPSFAVGRGGNDGYSSTMASVPYAGYQAGQSWLVDNNIAGTRFSLFNGNGNVQAALFTAVSMPGASTYAPSFVWGQQTDSTGAYAERMRMDPNGKLGIGTTAPTELLEVNGNLKVKHVVGSGLAPNVLAVTGAGTGATISVSAGSTDLAGVITLTTGTAPAANSQVFVLGFRSSYASAPSCVFSAGSADAAAKISAVYMQSNIANMGLWTTATALSASSMYVWHYHCAQ